MSGARLASRHGDHASGPRSGDHRRGLRDDPVAAAAEYGGQFRSDLEGYLAREALDAAIVRERYELARLPLAEDIGIENLDEVGVFL
jgi:hypothetical protein